MPPVLLDVNALIALFDPNHVHHVPVINWFGGARNRGWRTCPITENGLLRVISNPNYPGGAWSLADVARRLEKTKREGYYEFWMDEFSMSEWVQASGLGLASSKVTDAYLLALAGRKNGCLATFDLRITPSLIGSNDPAILEQIPC